MYYVTDVTDNRSTSSFEYYVADNRSTSSFEYYVADNRSTSSFENQHVYLLQHFDLLVLSFLSSERKYQHPRVLVCLSFFNIIAE